MQVGTAPAGAASLLPEAERGVRELSARYGPPPFPSCQARPAADRRRRHRVPGRDPACSTTAAWSPCTSWPTSGSTRWSATRRPATPGWTRRSRPSPRRRSTATAGTGRALRAAGQRRRLHHALRRATRTRYYNTTYGKGAAALIAARDAGPAGRVRRRAALLRQRERLADRDARRPAEGAGRAAGVGAGAPAAGALPLTPARLSGLGGQLLDPGRRPRPGRRRPARRTAAGSPGVPNASPGTTATSASSRISVGQLGRRRRRAGRAASCRAGPRPTGRRRTRRAAPGSSTPGIVAQHPHDRAAGAGRTPSRISRDGASGRR